MTQKGSGPPAGAAGFIRALPLVLLLLLAVLVFTSGVWRHLSLEEIRERRTALKALVRLHPGLALIGYVGLYAAVVALSVPGALIMSLSGGVLFGVFEGGLAAVAGISLGAVAMFLAARTSLGGWLGRRTASRPLFARLEAAMRRHAFFTLLALRLMPAAPIFMVNIGASLVRIPLSTYTAATILGVAPSTFVYASLGAGVDRLLEAGKPVGPRLVLEPAVLGPLVVLGLLAAGPPLFAAVRAARRRRVAERGGVL